MCCRAPNIQLLICLQILRYFHFWSNITVKVTRCEGSCHDDVLAFLQYTLILLHYFCYLEQFRVKILIFFFDDRMIHPNHVLLRYFFVNVRCHKLIWILWFFELIILGGVWSNLKVPRALLDLITLRPRSSPHKTQRMIFHSLRKWRAL